MTVPAETGVDRFLTAFGDWAPAAVVFDCDGMLLDTETVWDQTQRATLDHYGVTLAPEVMEGLVGSTLEVAARAIADAAGAPYQQVVDTAREQFQHDLGEELRFMPGALAALEAVASRVPVGCASNSWMEALQDKLARAGLLEKFGAIVAADTVAHPKPAPDMYVQAARELGADPARTLAFEDSVTGARAAVDGGLPLIAIPPQPIHVPGAHLRLETLADPGLLAWIDTWPAASG